MKALAVGVGVLVAGLATSANAINMYRFNGGYGGIHVTGAHLQGARDVVAPSVNSTGDSVHPYAVDKIAVRSVPTVDSVHPSGYSVHPSVGDSVHPSGDSVQPSTVTKVVVRDTLDLSAAAGLSGLVDASLDAAGSLDLDGLTDTLPVILDDGVIANVDAAANLGLDPVTDASLGLDATVADSTDPTDGTVEVVHPPRDLTGFAFVDDSASLDAPLDLSIPCLSLPTGLSIPGVTIPTCLPTCLPSGISLPVSIPGITIPTCLSLPTLSIPLVAIPTAIPTAIPIPTVIPPGIFPRGHYGVYGSTGVGYPTSTATYERPASSVTAAPHVSHNAIVEPVPHVKAVDQKSGSDGDATSMSYITITTFSTSTIEIVESMPTTTETPTETASEDCAADTTTITVTIVSSNAMTSHSTMAKYSNSTGIGGASTSTTAGSVTISSTDRGTSTATQTSSISGGTVGIANVNAAFLAGFAALAFFV